MITLFVCVLLVAATIAIHYESLRFASSRIAHVKIPPRMRIIVILAAALLSHTAQIFLYAVSYERSRHGRMDRLHDLSLHGEILASQGSSPLARQA